MGEEETPAVVDSSVKGDGTPRMNPATGQPYHPKQSLIDLTVDNAMDDLFETLDDKYVRLSSYQRKHGETGMSPSEMNDALKTWDLDEQWSDWWHGESDDPEVNEDGDRWDGTEA